MGERPRHALFELPVPGRPRRRQLLAGKPGARGFDVFVRAFEKGLLVRVTGDIIALSPPLIIERQHIDEVFGILAEVLRATS